MNISEWADVMWQTVVIHPFVDRDEYGKPSYSTPVTISNSRVVYKDFWLRKKDGSEVLAKGIVWLGSTMRISVEDKIVLPDGTDHPVLMSETYPNEEELNHTKVIFG